MPAPYLQPSNHLAVPRRYGPASIALSALVVTALAGCAVPAPPTAEGTGSDGDLSASSASTTEAEQAVDSTTGTPTPTVDDAITKVDFANMTHTFYLPHFEGISKGTIELVDGAGSPLKSDGSPGAFETTIESTEVVGTADLDGDGDLDAMVQFEGERSFDYGDHTDTMPIRQYTVWFWNAETKEPEQVEGELWLAGNDWATPAQSLGGVCRLALDETEDGEGGLLTMQFGTPTKEHPNNLDAYDCPSDPADLNGGHAITIVADPDTHEVTRAPSEGGGFAGASVASSVEFDAQVSGDEADAFADRLGTRVELKDGQWTILTPVDTGGAPITALHAPSLEAGSHEGDNGMRAAYTTHELGPEAPPEAWSWAYFVP